MKRLLLTLAIVLIASPVFAQEIDLIGGGIGDLLDIPAPRGARAAPPARGAAPNTRGATPSGPPVDRLVTLRDLLVKANSPLTKEQETGLNGLITTEIPLMRQTLQRRAMELMRARGGPPSTPAPGAVPPPMGTTPPAPPSPSRGAAPVSPPGGSAPSATAANPAAARGPAPTAAMLPSPEDLAPEIIRLNDQLLGKIAAAPVLNPEQQAVVKKLYKDQIKSRGGFDAIKMTMEDASAPFNAEQVAQIQPLFDDKERAKVQLTKDAAGQPVEKAKLDQLDRDTLAKVLKLLTPAQRTALLQQPKP